VADATSIAPQRIMIGFARMPNLSPTELRLNAATVRLLERCTGDIRADTLVAQVIADMAPVGGEAPAALEQQAFAILARMYAAGVVAFAGVAAPSVPLSYGS
jgi:hypothetical protein